MNYQPSLPFHHLYYHYISFSISSFSHTLKHIHPSAYSVSLHYIYLPCIHFSTTITECCLISTYSQYSHPIPPHNPTSTPRFSRSDVHDLYNDSPVPFILLSTLLTSHCHMYIRIIPTCLEITIYSMLARSIYSRSRPMSFLQVDARPSRCPRAL